ncbi:hypothetical protein [Sanguibacter sp. 25GB23B1]|uniref:hypothetical protein n=1 Tax=unclassified Sanguibacter TaxID=2645534 RepID=UPI0032AFCDBC
MTSDLPAPAATGTVTIDSIDELLLNVARVEETLIQLAEARLQLKTIATRPPRQAWSAVPSLVTFAATYGSASSAIIAVLDQAELKIVGMAEAIRTYAAEMQWQDQATLDALSSLERRVDDALAAPPLVTSGLQYNGQSIKTRQHQQPI